METVSIEYYTSELSTAVAVPNSTTNIPAGNIKKIVYTNTSTGIVNLEIYNGGVLYLVTAINPLTTFVHDFEGVYLHGGTTLSHKASVAASVNFTLLVGI